MGALVGRILTFLAGWGGSMAVAETAKFVAWKAFILVVVITIFPIMLTNWLHFVMGKIINVANAHASGSPGLVSQVAHLTGLAAYFAEQLGLPASASIILSAIAFRVGMQMIPFVGLGR